MNRKEVRIKVPDHSVTQPHTPKDKHEPEVCDDCGGWGTLTNGFDGHPEMCRTCEGSGEL